MTSCDVPTLTALFRGERRCTVESNYRGDGLRLTYSRTVGEVLTDDPDRANLNLVQVHSGSVAVYRIFCEGRAYYQAEQKSKRIGAGIWERPGDRQAPWEMRRG